MFTEAFHSALARTLAFEGRIADRGSADRGGLTNFGITHTLAREYGIRDVRTLTLDEARFIYHDAFWNKLALDTILCDPLRKQLFDFAVTSGPESSARALQRAWNVLFTPSQKPLLEDGDLGPLTVQAVNEKLQKYGVAMVNAFLGERWSFYKGIWKVDPAYASQNIRGWAKRI